MAGRELLLFDDSFPPRYLGFARQTREGHRCRIDPSESTTELQQLPKTPGYALAKQVYNRLYLTGGNVNDYKGVEVLLEKLPKRVEHFLGEMGYDSNEIRNILESMGITPCIPGRSMRNQPIQYDKKLYK